MGWTGFLSTTIRF